MTEGACFLSADYSVLVPRAKFNEIEVVEAEVQPEPVSFEILKNRGFRFEIDISLD